ncbi:DUF4865 family protein [bacterium M00.F.Ca.ET.228.01.1.1]|uniref:DUF4865 family protein n=1 Tax=Paraburkholderia phenoliruptrix TaxID=252970 RepID=UPI00109273FC|nr:DUF4865 family protein [Paraburkholderia phenoliruptrix]TGP47989.1 DUF4865 family protein [bacterium M00.F.Ca.ET.228.01.1.1]TGS05781.1 DUF4865 family protein [bacterium M00.F.Ca.ET.191.01.1.1]TGU10718.1 DUF4865 family protein [bacterium M00.F.Ca.ET.155.01.1.1]MBW0445194.1 DUF4865 family protein [Paraburkholderia phenoliruptrix]MBW9095959.1 DUF4865 family protein [Paraburkholderia phenoliruptrix]
MLIKQYEHRLPSDYDMTQIRERGRTRGLVWADAQGLAFKAFALRERGLQGGAHNAYTSIYLWLADEAAAEFVTGPRFKSVIESFGRPPIQTWLPIDARIGRSAQALSIYREDVALPEGTDLSALREIEIDRNARIADGDDIVAAMVGLDMQNWRLARFTLSAAPLRAVQVGIGYEIAYLAAPGLAQLATRSVFRSVS